MSCPDCFTGSIKHNEKPTGAITTIHGRETYVAKPPNGRSAKGIIIIIPDAFGLPFINNQILADNYASMGDFLVYLPDFMDGTAAPTWVIGTMGKVMGKKSIMDWVTMPYHIITLMSAFIPFMTRNSYPKSMPKVESFFTAVRANEGKDLPIGAAGFCWGGQHTVRLAHGVKNAEGKLLCDAGFTAHPSGLKLPEDIKKMVEPVAFAIAENDMAVNAQKGREIEAELRAMPEVKFEVVIYEAAGHGFAVRADPGNEKVSQHAKDAEAQAVKWYQKVFSEKGFAQ